MTMFMCGLTTCSGIVFAGLSNPDTPTFGVVDRPSSALSYSGFMLKWMYIIE